MRIGIGYDIHRLEEGRDMVLGGVTIPSSVGPLGHSDGDVVIHAICDAILGAMREGDIGMMFPDTDPRYKGAASSVFLKEVRALMEKKGYKVVNIDCVIIAEEPKIAPYKTDMIRSIEEILGAHEGAVNIKGKTAESLGDIGQEKAIAVHSVALLEKKETT